MADASGGSVVWNLDVDDSQLVAGLDAAAAKVASFSDLTKTTDGQIAESFTAMTNTGVADFADLRLAATSTALGMAESFTGAEAQMGEAAAGSAVGFGALTDAIKESVLPLAALFIGAKGIEDTFKDVTDETNTYNSAQAQLTNTIRSTKDSLGLSLDQFDQLADSMSTNTTVTDAANLAALNTLANYKSIGEDVFPLAAKQVDNLATAMANVQGNAVPSLQNTTYASQLLGKALEDPATGTDALQRVGIKFSSSQVAVIKSLQDTGNTAGAQKQFISDLADVVSGKASAATQTYQGKIVDLQNVLYEFGSKYIKDVQNGLLVLGGIFANIGSAIIANKPLLTILEGAFVGLSVLGIGALIFAIGGAIAGFIGLDLAALPWIAAAAVIGGGLAWLVSLFGGWNSIMKDMQPTFEVMANIWTHDIWPVLKVVGDFIGQQLNDAWRDMQSAIASLSKTLAPYHTQLEEIAEVIGVALLVALVVVVAPILAIGAAFVATVVIGARLIGWIAEAIAWFVQFAINVNNSIDSFQNSVNNGFRNVISWFVNLPANIVKAVGNLGSVLYDAGKNLIQGLIDGINGMWNGAVNSVKNVASGAVNAVKNLLGIHSPSTVFQEIGQNIGQGLVNGLNASQTAVQGAMSDLTSQLGVDSNLNVDTSVIGSGVVMGGSTSSSPESSQGSVPAAITVHVNQSGIIARSRADLRDIGKDMISAVNEELRARHLPEIANGAVSGRSTV